MRILQLLNAPHDRPDRFVETPSRDILPALHSKECAYRSKRSAMLVRSAIKKGIIRWNHVHPTICKTPFTKAAVNKNLHNGTVLQRRSDFLSLRSSWGHELSHQRDLSGFQLYERRRGYRLRILSVHHVVKGWERSVSNVERPRDQRW